MTNTKYNEAGRSMIEMLGVLAIIGVLSVGGIAGYSKAMMKYKVNRSMDEITQIATNIRTLFGGQRNYSALTAPVVRDAKLVPGEMGLIDAAADADAAMEFENPWGGTFTITVVAKTDNDSDKAFMIESKDIPTEACIELAVIDWGAASGSGLVAMSAGADLTSVTEQTCEQTTEATAGAATVCAKVAGGPMTPDIAVAACSKTTADGTQDMYWKFY